MGAKPDWRITTTRLGKEIVPVSIQLADAQPFGDLVHFSKGAKSKGQPKVLLVAPKSGHYATLLRDTLERLLPEADLYITDWRNARDVPLALAVSTSRIMSRTCSTGSMWLDPTSR